MEWQTNFASPDTMRTCADIARFIAGQPWLMAMLEAVEALDIVDGWIGAGLIRNAVWDHLHGMRAEPVAGSDIDVVYCDHNAASLERDNALEARLRSAIPHAAWSVHNQARMHERNGDLPYKSTAEALRCWPETATAIAARSLAGRVEILAPLGVGDLLDMVVRPTPRFLTKLDVYRARQNQKAWAQRWPRLRFVRE